MRALPARRAAAGGEAPAGGGGAEGAGAPVGWAWPLTLDLSASVRATLEELAARLATVETERREAGGTRARARSERERLGGAVARIEAELAGLPDARPAQVRQQQAGVARMRTVRGELERLGEQRAELRRQFESARTQGDVPPSDVVLPVWWVPAVAAVVVVLSVVAWLLAGTVVGALSLAGGLLLTGVLELARRRVEARAMRGWRPMRRAAVEAAGGGTAALGAGGAGGARGTAAPRSGPPRGGRHDPRGDGGGPDDTEARWRKRWSRPGGARCSSATGEAPEGHGKRWGGAARGGDAAGGRGTTRELSTELAAHLSARHFPSALPASAALTLWRDAAVLRQRLLDVGAEEAALTVDERACAPMALKLWQEAVAAGLASGLGFSEPGSTRATQAMTARPAQSALETVAARVSAALDSAREQTAERRVLEQSRRELLAEKARLDGLSRRGGAGAALLLAEGGGADEESFRRRAAQARRYARAHPPLTRAVSANRSTHRPHGGPRAREPSAKRRGEEGLHTSLGTRRARHTEAQERNKAVLTSWAPSAEQLGAGRRTTSRHGSNRRGSTLGPARSGHPLRGGEADAGPVGPGSAAFEEEQQPRVVQLASEHSGSSPLVATAGLRLAGDGRRAARGRRRELRMGARSSCRAVRGSSSIWRSGWR